MIRGSFESAEQNAAVCATQNSLLRSCFKFRASVLARGHKWSRIGHSARTVHEQRSVKYDSRARL